MRGYLACDIGASALRVGFFDEEGRLVRWRRHKLPPSLRRGEFERLLLGALKDILGKDVAHAVGIGSVGPLDQQRGELLGPVNLKVGRLNLRALIERGLGLGLSLLNDCKAAALGEFHWAWRARGYRFLVYVGIGTGIGGGVIEDGRLLLGRRGNASEVGHMTLVRDGRPCGCGGRGHWEAYCSGLNLPLYFAEWSAGARAYAGARELLQAAKRGEPSAQRFIEHIKDLNALALSNLCNLYDPELIVLGGGVMRGNARLLLRGLRDRMSGVLAGRVGIRPSALGELAVLRGAIVPLLKGSQ
ncbi:MAG: hypothetical protein C4339_02630 [Nitrososphaerota archaeon]